MRMFRTFTGMNLVRRSLGLNGCGVKPRNRRVGGSATPWTASQSALARWRLTSLISALSAAGSAISASFA
jgi:hypothetical protein